MNYLDEYWDDSAITPRNWDELSIATHEVIRLGRLAQVAEVSATLKRRIDGGSPGELAIDKKRARQIAHIARQMGGGWLSELKIKGSLNRVEPGKSGEWTDIMRSAATVNWLTYVAESEDELRDRCRLVVTWALRKGQRAFANRAANRYVTESQRMVETLTIKGRGK